MSIRFHMSLLNQKWDMGSFRNQTSLAFPQGPAEKFHGFLHSVKARVGRRGSPAYLNTFTKFMGHISPRSWQATIFTIETSLLALTLLISRA